jgi:hypothetical protein
MVLTALNRAQDIEETAMAAANYWTYDLFSRKPSPAYNDYGVFKGTDLDLACFLYALVGRNAVINIPRYKAATVRTERADQKLTSTANRNGRLMGVKANKDFWKFNISIIDQNVIKEDDVGDWRTFSLTDYDGSWYDGWDRIEFVPTLNENKFITESELWSGQTIHFSNFIHPNRWTSFFGHHYVISKLVVERLSEEVKNLNAQMKAMKAAGVSFPAKGESPASYDGYTYGDAKSVKFQSFQAKIFIPEMGLTGEWPSYEQNQETLVEIYKKRKRLANLKDGLMFMTRATEYAHSINPDRMPHWIKNVEWEDGFKESSRSRIEWQRLKLFQPEVGKHAVSILKRTYEKSARVSADYGS